MARHIFPAFSLYSRLDEFKQFQEFCLQYQHGIQRKQRGIPLYSEEDNGAYESRRATTFIYAFFAFNDIYKIDWKRSLTHPQEEPYEWDDGSQQEMFWRMVASCFGDSPDNVHPFTTRLVKYCRRLGVEKPVSELKGISENSNAYLNEKLASQYAARQKKGKEISLQSIADFRASFRALYENGTQKTDARLADGLTHINNVLYFVYLVRCSVFHGRKQLTITNLGRDLDVRLAIYAAVLLAINQVVIEWAEKQLG